MTVYRIIKRGTADRPLIIHKKINEIVSKILVAAKMTALLALIVVCKVNNSLLTLVDIPMIYAIKGSHINFAVAAPSLDLAVCAEDIEGATRSLSRAKQAVSCG